MRERLIELLLNCYDDPNLQYYDLTEITDKFMGGAEYLADYLLKNGVVVLPCNVGDIVWMITTQRDTFDDYPYKTVCAARFTLRMLGNFGKTVFLTKEEAKAALEGVVHNDKP